MAYDLIFTNGRVLDGTGSPWLTADVAIADGRIVAVGRELGVEAARTIDVGGQIVAPGFYDMHSHADVMLLAEPRHEGKVFQGVTFELLGQDGLSYAPVTPEILKQIRRHLAGLNGDDPRAGWDWTSVGSYLDRFERTTAVNVGYLVPHNAVRIGALGWEMRTATAAELDRMRGLVREGMEDGAFGLSTALTYPPNLWSDTDEMVAMCEVVARFGGIYVTHLRGQGDALLDPIREAIAICQRAGLPLHISHLKSSRLGGPTNLPGLLALLGTDPGRDFPLEAAAQPDQPLGVLREQILVDARLVIEPLGVAGRHELDQVVVALVGLGEEHQVIRRLPRRAALGPPVARRHVDFAAEDRIDPALACLIVEDHRREHVPVLGDRHRRHLQLDRLVEQLLDPARAVEEGVLGMQMEMHELHGQCRMPNAE